MIWAVAASVFAGLAGVILWLWEKASHGETALKLSKTQHHLAVASDELQKSLEGETRASDVNAYLKKQLDGLHAELLRCDDLGAARNRLAKLLARGGGTDSAQ